MSSLKQEEALMGKSRNSASVGGRKDSVMSDGNVQNTLYTHVTVHEQKREKAKYIFKSESSFSIMLGSCLKNEEKNTLYLNYQIFCLSSPLVVFPLIAILLIKFKCVQNHI